MILGCFLCIAFTLQTYGLRYLDISVSAFLTGTNLIFIPFFYFLLFQKSIPSLNILSIILAIIGIFYFNYQPGIHIKGSISIILTLGSAMAFALHIIYTSYFLNKNEDIINLFIFQCIFTSLFSLILALFFEPFPKSFDFKILGAIVYLGLIASILCYGLQFLDKKLFKALLKQD